MQIAAALQPLLDGGRVLEVGPGGGALTQHVLKIPGIELHACELDDRYVVALPGRFPALAGRIYHGSFLRMPLDDCPQPPFAVVGNFPYNISSQIVFRVLEWSDSVPVMVGMFQREVARRLVADPGNKDYGVLSVLVASLYHTEYLFELPPEAFDPPPKVHSAVIRLQHRQRTDAPDPKALKRVVKAAFAMRRKKLRNALQGWEPAARLAEPLFDRRAENLSTEEFEALAMELQPPS